MKTEATSITFGMLQGFLRDLGFTTVLGPRGYLMNDHADSGCKLYYPPFGDTDDVPIIHLAKTRRFLDEFGVLAADEFDAELRRHSVAG